MSRSCAAYQYCDTHGFRHGGEAEELRAGIEKAIKANSLESCYDDHEYKWALKHLIEDLTELLDNVDARDSLAFEEAIRAEEADVKEDVEPE